MEISYNIGNGNGNGDGKAWGQTVWDLEKWKSANPFPVISTVIIATAVVYDGFSWHEPTASSPFIDPNFVENDVRCDISRKTYILGQKYCWWLKENTNAWQQGIDHTYEIFATITLQKRVSSDCLMALVLYT